MSTKTRFEKEAWGNSEMAYSTIASGEVHTILFITVAFCSALNIPFESEQKQKFQITKSPPVLHAKRKYSLTLDNFSLSSQQLIAN